MTRHVSDRFGIALAIVAMSLAAAACPRTPCPEPPAGGSGGGMVVVAGGLEGHGEGMWPVARLDAIDASRLGEHGLEIPWDAVWTEGRGGLASAVINLDGCTASFVSADGLVVTNHHCAFDLVSRNATPERNLIDEGFVAASRAEELDGYGTTAKILVAFTDVTDRVGADLPGDPLERIAVIQERESALVAECETRPDRRCSVARFNDGLAYAPPAPGSTAGVRRYVLFETVELRDVRLVAAPPLGVGEYGGEVDNWHWPRHDGDWAFLRAYVGPDGRAADFAPENVPFRPEHWLRVATQDIDPGDVVAVMGYPGATQRHQTAVEVEEAQEWYFPTRLEVFSLWIDELQAAADESDRTRILVAPMLKSFNNGRSHAIGMIAALRRSGLLEARRAEEAAFRAWVDQDRASRAAFAEALDGVAAVVAERRATRDLDFLLRYLPRACQVLGFARTITKWAAERPKPDLEREPGYQDRDEDPLRRDMEAAEKSLDLEADRRVLAAFVRRAMALPEGQRIAPLDEALGADRSDAAIDAWTRRLYAGTTLGDTATRLAAFGRSLDELRASDDEMLRLGLALLDTFDAQLERVKRFDVRIAEVRPRYVEGLEQSLGRPLYPDANGTLRFTAGTICGYLPGDGAAYAPFTTVRGLLEKETGEAPFASPPAVLEAVRRGDLGRWVDPDLGSVAVNFLADVDTTGGNSGSPALNGRGELIGLLFDGVWEDLAGDYVYDPAVSRSIVVDFRYVLWYLDRVAGAGALLEELGLRAE